MRKGPLGKGLGALIPTEKSERGYLMVGIEEIKPNSSQPRKGFDDGSLEGLAASIKEKGILQPLVLRRGESRKGYEIVAGERRWRAAQKAGLTKVPAIIKVVDDRDALELALVENLQREDLNPIEEARAYEQLIEDFGLTHEEISKRIGKERSTITNQLRLLKLPREAGEALIRGVITPGHARALLSVQSPKIAKQILHAIMKGKLSVRTTENMVKKLAQSPTGNGEEGSAVGAGDTSGKDAIPSYIKPLTEELKRALGTQVRIIQKGGGGDGGGRIEIEYYSENDLQRLIDILLGRMK